MGNKELFPKRFLSEMTGARITFTSANNGNDFFLNDLSDATERSEALIKDDVIGKSIQEIFPWAKKTGFLSVLRQVWKTEKSQIWAVPEGADKKHPIRMYHVSKDGDEKLSVHRYDVVAMDGNDQAAAKEICLRSMFSTVSAGIGLVENGVLRDANNFLCRLSGYRKSDLIGTPVERLFLAAGKVSNDSRGNRESLERLKPKNREMVMKRKGGDYLDVLVSSNTIDSENDAYVFTVIDISERKKSERASRENRKRFLSLFQNIRDAVYISPLPDGESPAKFEWVNRAACDMVGYSRKELTLMSPHELDDPELLPTYLPEALQTLKTNQSILFEAMQVHKNGTKIPVEISVSKVQIEGRPYTIAMARDIRERKKTASELQKISTAVNQSPVSVIITDSLGAIEYVNPRFTEMTGYSAKEAIGKDPGILKSGRMPRQHYDNLWKTILEGRVWRGEFLNKKKNGELYWEAAVISSIKNEQGKVTNFVAVSTDISERKRLWTELIETKERAEFGDRLKSRFLANMSHEIRTPLNGILGFSRLLGEPHLSEQERCDYLRSIQESGERMLTIINDLLDTSMIESGDTDVTLDTVRINEILTKVANIYRPLAEKKNLAFDSIPGLPDAESLIVTDKRMLEKTLTSLVDNAVKYTTKGCVAFGYKKNDDLLEFFVRDTGVGIDKAMQGTIFESFRQIELDPASGHEGAGLGLSMSRFFVEKLGGALWVDSTTGKGSTFYFSLPYNPPVNAQEESTSSKTDDFDATGVAFSPEFTVLVVDDDPINRLLLKSVLVRKNATVLLAENGMEAVEEVSRRTDLAVVLMDMKMPVMNGYEATARIRQIRPSLPVIGQSAFASPAEKEAAINAGCKTVVAKPIDFNELLKAILRYTSA